MENNLVVWNYRETNSCADALAGFASKAASENEWFNRPVRQLNGWPDDLCGALPMFCFAWWRCQPSYLCNYTFHDVLGIPTAREVIT
ncbi:hypothetical protein FRX31_023956 [Thalictrum thalictroides]|uniref:Uncharacterized protein n=1 Tax=Thalictrum thalictroides TaxID=46969 RepID=A0A7J6VPI5_THATH|nr:hypothetical protein FRX31_023956 [Thalictrum thalictroides]